MIDEFLADIGNISFSKSITNRFRFTSQEPQTPQTALSSSEKEEEMNTNEMTY